MTSAHDAVVVGSGPNGLAAAITLLKAGLSVLVIERSEAIGGGLRSRELTEPGFLHDVCSAVHPLAASSPFFDSLDLARHGVEWIHPPAALAHPLDDGSAAIAYRSLEDTCRELPDGAGYKRLIGPLAADWPRLRETLLGPLGWPAAPLAFARFGAKAWLPATAAARIWLSSERSRALWAGIAAHSIIPLESFFSSSFGFVLGALAHVQGWPLPRGGSGRIAAALAKEVEDLGGSIETGRAIENIGEIAGARLKLLDVSPRQLSLMARGALPPGYERSLRRYRYGPGAFKIDWALGSPIPWKNPECGKAGTVHLGGTLAEVARSESAAWNGNICDRPFVLLCQPSLFDHGRAPIGKHTAWAYCHVPNGCKEDMTGRIEAQIERFAPGFRDIILARAVRTPEIMERDNPNLIGGDIGGGANSFPQLLFRPGFKACPYATPMPGVYLCSSSTPPGGGVHGACGYHAAKAALRWLGK